MKRLLIGLLLCCGLTAQAQLTFTLSGSQTTINGNGGSITNIGTNGISAPFFDWLLTLGGAPSGDSLWFTNTAAGGIGITNNFGARVTAGTSWSTLTSTGMATYASSVAQAVYGNQYISYQGVNGIDLATGFTLLDGTDSPALQPQSRALVGNWNAQGNFDVDGDLNVDGTLLLNDGIITNLFTIITNSIAFGNSAGKLTNSVVETAAFTNGVVGRMLIPGTSYYITVYTNVP